MSFRISRKLPLWLAISVFSLQVSQLLAASLDDARAFSLPAKQLADNAAAESADVKFPAIVLLDDEHWTFHADNSIERKQHVIYRVLTTDAVQSWASVQERWEPWHQERPAIRARVVSPDGSEHDLDEKTVVDAPAGSNAPQTYSDLRLVQSPLPAIEVGSVVETEITTRFTPVLGSIAFEGSIAWRVPVKRSRLSAEYPETLSLRYAALLCPNVKQTKESSGGTVHLTLDYGAIEPLSTVEPLLPFDVPRGPTAVLSTGASWNDIAQHYSEIVDRQIVGAPIEKFSAQAIAGKASRLTIITRLVRALHSEIRYTGVEFSEAAIIPAKPFDTLARKYGDCKDKATLLVAMLRAAGIPAYVALLKAGLDEDVLPGYPGMGLFNHAIVYVPGSPDIWIDATSEHSEVGSLPPPDEGRLALIIKPDTAGLTRIPESASAKNVSLTTREFHIPQYGPAHVMQAIEGAGAFDAAFRDIFSMTDSEEGRKQMVREAQAQWNTKAEVKITRGDLNDYSRPFRVRMDVSDAKAVTMSETSSEVSIPVSTVLQPLPEWFGTEEPKQTESDDTKKKASRTADFVLPEAFVAKFTTIVEVPPGFEARKLPENSVVKMGPATYSAHFSAQGTSIIADIQFDSAKRTYTLAEATAMRKAILDFFKQPVPSITVEPKAQALLDAGHIGEGIQAYKADVGNNPQSVVHHVRLSRAYLAAGCGLQARGEAERATQIAASSVPAWRNLGFVFEHDLIGRKFKKGWDPDGTERALRKALSLDKSDATIPAELAESLEYDAFGERYGSIPRLNSAIEVYRAMGDDKLEEQGLTDFLLYDLVYAGRFEEAKPKLETRSPQTRLLLRTVITAAQQGSSHALDEIDKAGPDPEVRNSVLGNGYVMLLSIGKYPEAAALLSAALRNGTDHSQGLAKAQALQNTQHIDLGALKPDSPANLVSRYAADVASGGESEKEALDLWSSLAPRERVREFFENA
ncbi:MAG: DUF3857 domain-containing protein, partial [Acidobacteriaceae bacterium]|nr:DUF3857 domain-containing protein [Acidobacteriaceae bacterium]